MQLQIDHDSLKKILSDYKKLVNLNISIHDKDYKPVHMSSEGQKNFCHIIREHSEIRNACKQCDIMAFKEVEKTKELYVYKCHMGLYEAVAPIIDNGMIIGFIMVGQILDEQALNYQWLRIKTLCQNYGLDEVTYRDAFFELNQISLERIEASANILNACATYLCYKNIMSVERSNLFSQIDLYINNHIGDSLGQEVLCHHFHISRSTLYNLMIDNTSKSLTYYVQEKRMARMKTLLIDTDRKVKDISETVGIDDYNYCTRLFKRTYGISPRVYRETYTD